MRAVVFAYHNVGVRCLKVLLARGVDIALVITHEDNPAETIWFESVSALCKQHGIPAIAPSDPAAPELLAQVAALQPDFIFSFYYRHMLPVALLGKRNADGTYEVHVVTAGRQVVPRTLKIGVRTQQQAQVLSGLEAGEQVLVGPVPAALRPKPAAPVVKAANTPMGTP